MTQPSIQIHTIVSAPFAENSYIAWLDSQKEVILFDPGLQPDLILSFLNENDLNLSAILNTHGHADHIAGNQTMKDHFPNAPLMIGAGDAFMLTDSSANMSRQFGFDLFSPPADRLLHEGDTIDLAGIQLDVLDIPGHSPGHIVFVYRSQPIIVFGGDVLFREGIGRYDFPDSDGELLMNGIREKLYAFPDDTVVYPGHGPVTTIGHEKKSNPFVRPLA